MVNFDKLYTYDKPRNRTAFYIDSIMKFFVLSGVVLVALWIASEVLFKGNLFGIDFSFLRITNIHAPGYTGDSVNTPVPVSLAYVGLGIGFLGGAIMYIAPILLAFILAPPGGKARTLVVNDDQFAETTYECGEEPKGSGHGQVNLQYYSFALVFVIFDIITALTLMFALVFSLGAGVDTSLTFGSLTYIPTADDVILQIVAILFFVLSPLLVLGFWLRKKAILWQ